MTEPPLTWVCPLCKATLSSDDDDEVWNAHTARHAAAGEAEALAQAIDEQQGDVVIE